MRTQFIVAALALAGAATTSFAAGNNKHDDHAPRHGGLVVPGKEADFELVAKPDAIQLYVSDHGKPMDLSKASAKLTLLNGGTKQEVELKPAGNKLEAKGSFQIGTGTKAVAVVANNGKTLGTARFALK